MRLRGDHGLGRKAGFKINVRRTKEPSQRLACAVRAHARIQHGLCDHAAIRLVTIDLFHQRHERGVRLGGGRLFRLLGLVLVRLDVAPLGLAVLLHEQVIVLVIAVRIHAFDLRVKGIGHTVDRDLGPGVDGLAAARADARARDRLGIIAHLARQIGKHARPRIAVAALILQHIDRLLDLPAIGRGIHLADTEITKGFLGVVIHCTQLFKLGHVVGHNTCDRICQQAVQLGVAGGVAAVAVKFQAVHRGVAVKDAIRVDVEQQTADVVPALSQASGLLVVARPALDAVCLVVLVVSGRLEHIQIRPVGIRHVRHHTDAIAGGCHRRVRRAAEHAVEDGHDLGAGDRIVRTERTACPRDPALRERGLHCLIGPVGRGHIGKGLLGADIIVREAGQDGDKLRAGDGGVRAEGAILITVYQRKAGHLVNSRRIPCARCNVRKYIVAAAGLLDQQAGEQLAGFCAGDGGVRAEGAVCIAIHILHMLGGVEHGRALLRRIFCGGRAGRNRQRARCHQRGERRGSDLSFHGYSPLSLECSAGLDVVSPRLVPFFPEIPDFLFPLFPAPPPDRARSG